MAEAEVRTYSGLPSLSRQIVAYRYLANSPGWDYGVLGNRETTFKHGIVGFEIAYEVEENGICMRGCVTEEDFTKHNMVVRPATREEMKGKKFSDYLLTS